MRWNAEPYRDGGQTVGNVYELRTAKGHVEVWASIDGGPMRFFWWEENKQKVLDYMQMRIDEGWFERIE